MAQPRMIRKRIGSIRNINKITSTMERVAQSRALKLSNRLTGIRAFRDRVAGNISSSFAGEKLVTTPHGRLTYPEFVNHPLCRPRPGTEPVTLLVLTSNRGLCGGYNTRVLAAARARIREIEATGRKARVVVVGRRGASALRYVGQPVVRAVTDVDEATPYSRWNEVMDEIFDEFLKGQSGFVDVVSMRYRTKAQQEARASWFLPFRPDFQGAAAAVTSGVLYKVEPSREAFLEGALSLLARAELTCLLGEALLSEQIQRTMAMRGASDSADGVLKTLTRQYNRARQAQITAEMIEIIGGSESMSGDE